jgi:hypothetical protein
MLSFRAVFGWWYYQQYCSARVASYAVIEDMIKHHTKAGLVNPIFFYDPESYLWFIDFSRVSQDKKGVRIEEVIQTVGDIRSCFVHTARFAEKYSKAIKKFYTNRTRPPDRRVCIPTLRDCGMQIAYPYTWEDTRRFTPDKFVLR